MTPMRGVGPIPFMLEAPASFPVVAGLVPANPNCHYAVLENARDPSARHTSGPNSPWGASWGPREPPPNKYAGSGPTLNGNRV
jgi:hypothetical protein